MVVSIIIPTYKDVTALTLILEALSKQTYRDFEVIIAEDDDSEAIRRLLLSVQVPFPVKHFSQEDRGWRKARAVNRSILLAEGEYLIFFDGDCLPYSTFVEAHVALSEANRVLCGRRVNLGDGFSQQLRERVLSVSDIEKHLFGFWAKLKKDGARHIEQGLCLFPGSILYRMLIPFLDRNKKLVGCNFSLHKKDLLRINGFDESYPSGDVADDVDVEWRLNAVGVQNKSCKYAANLLHLNHPRADRREAHKRNYQMMLEKQRNNEIVSKQGIFEEDQHSQNTKLYDSLFPDDRLNAAEPLRQAQFVMLRILKIIDHICSKHKIEYWLDGGTLLGAVRHKGFIPWDDDIDIAMMRDDYDRFLEIVESELPDDLYFQTPENDHGFMNMIAPVKIRDLKSLILEGYEDGTEPYHQGLFVDIFPYDHLPSGKRKRKFCKYLGKKLLKIKRAKLEKHRRHHGHLVNSVYGKLLSVEKINRLLRFLIKRVNRENADVIGFGLDSTLTRFYEKERFFPLQRIEFEGSRFLAPKDTDYYLRVSYGDYMTLPPKEEQVPKHLSKLIPLLKDADEQ